MPWREGFWLCGRGPSVAAATCALLVIAGFGVAGWEILAAAGADAASAFAEALASRPTEAVQEAYSAKSSEDWAGEREA